MGIGKRPASFFEKALAARPAATANGVEVGLFVSEDDTPTVNVVRVKASTGLKEYLDIPSGAGGGAIVYPGGTVVPGTSKALNFTADPSVTRYYLTADTLTIVLDSADPVGQTYEFWSTTGSAAPNHTLAPNGGLTINGAATIAYSRQWGGQVVTKTSATTWQMAL